MSKHESIYGLHAVRAVLSSQPERVLSLFVAGRDDERLKQLLSLAQQAGVPVQSIKAKTLSERAGGGAHQGVMAHVRPAKALNESHLDALLDECDASGRAPLLLVLDGVTDPHNLGACLRTADAAGVTAVIVPRDKSAQLSGTVSKVACGAAETMPLIQVTNLARALRHLQERGVWLVGTAGETDTMLYQSRLTGPMALVMGAEGKGMRRLTREVCDELIAIPMAGSVSSLNVSVATGVCLFEAVRQRS